MTLRLTDEEAESLRGQAEAEGRSMQDVAREAVREYVERRTKHVRINAILDRELPRYAEALERLGQ
jgi:predicted transcriptional regulator